MLLDVRTARSEGLAGHLATFGQIKPMVWLWLWPLPLPIYCLRRPLGGRGAPWVPPLNAGVLQLAMRHGLNANSRMLGFVHGKFRRLL